MTVIAGRGPSSDKVGSANYRKKCKGLVPRKQCIVKTLLHLKDTIGGYQRPVFSQHAQNNKSVKICTQLVVNDGR